MCIAINKDPKPPLAPIFYSLEAFCQSMKRTRAPAKALHEVFQTAFSQPLTRLRQQVRSVNLGTPDCIDDGLDFLKMCSTPSDEYF